MVSIRLNYICIRMGLIADIPAETLVALSPSGIEHVLKIHRPASKMNLGLLQMHFISEISQWVAGRSWAKHPSAHDGRSPMVTAAVAFTNANNGTTAES